jgi:predicted hotdog family 3-hydroxylacyl-ACP dehydratase
MTVGGEFPDVSMLLPQKGPMRLLSRVLEHTLERTACAANTAGSELFRDGDGTVPAWVALEYMAQCMAVHAGLAARSRGEAVQPALLLGSRRLQLSVDRFESDRTLWVCAKHHRGQRGLVAFDCEVRDEPGRELLASGRLLAYTLKDGLLGRAQ